MFTLITRRRPRAAAKCIAPNRNKLSRLVSCAYNRYRHALAQTLAFAPKRPVTFPAHRPLPLRTQHHSLIFKLKRHWTPNSRLSQRNFSAVYFLRVSAFCRRLHSHVFSAFAFTCACVGDSFVFCDKGRLSGPRTR